MQAVSTMANEACQPEPADYLTQESYASQGAAQGSCASPLLPVVLWFLHHACICLVNGMREF